ncbi:hypothetical protein HDV05_001094, partial [Chytridiales sp. JEL 0842]
MEMDIFLSERADVKFLEGKRADGKGRGGHGQSKQVKGKGKAFDAIDAEPAPPPTSKSADTGGLSMSKQQQVYFNKIREFVLHRKNGPSRIFFPPALPARDKKFIIGVAKDLGLQHGISLPEHDPGTSSSSSEEEMYPVPCLSLSWDEDDDEDDEESLEARKRVFKKYDAANVVDEAEIAKNLEIEAKQKVEMEFVEWKREYYKIDMTDDVAMHKIVHNYVEGLQWVLLYYYRGVPSWEWFFRYHYAPKITDLVNLHRFHPIVFDKGRPFLPFEQLMGVLPAASSAFIPECFRVLMTDPTSPIIDFYPTSFDLDLNGKKQDWEAVVKIPFIDEERLIKALRARENQLTKEEKRRNSHSHAWVFVCNPLAPYHYPSTIPSFPDIAHCTAVIAPFYINQPDQLYYGLVPGSRLGIDMLPGFPSMHTIPHTATLGFHGVNVFNTESLRESIIVSVQNRFEGKPIDEVAF